MHRTFPDNILFKSKAEPSLQGALYNVLLAYGQHNKAVGYCQVRRASGDAASALYDLKGATLFSVLQPSVYSLLQKKKLNFSFLQQMMLYLCVSMFRGRLINNVW